MAEPSNIRINPFTGTGGATNYVELTEKHIIPSVSPYVIRLNEVPEKQDPSNMKMVYVDSATGVVTENTLTEVAATPGQGEFRPDYSTNALDDKTWNTGLIEFSASDAGKIVQVTYTGTGTLAGVTSNHWPSWYTDRGDGSDGDFVPTEDTTISGVKNYKSVFIKSGLTITVDKYVLIKCQGAFINNGTITANGKGAPGGAGGTGYSNDGVGAGRPGSSGSAGLSNGGAGGSNSIRSGGVAGGSAGGINFLGITSYLESLIKEIIKNIPIHFVGAGGGGGAGNYYKNSLNGGKGGNGGGCVIICSNEFANKGTISSKGENGGNGASDFRTGAGGGGGGGGGAVIIVSSKINELGTTEISGGAGGTGGLSSDSYWGANNGAAGNEGLLYTRNLGE